MATNKVRRDDSPLVLISIDRESGQRSVTVRANPSCIDNADRLFIANELSTIADEIVREEYRDGSRV